VDTVGPRPETRVVGVKISDEIEACELCERDRPLTFHHLIPRTLHRKKRYRDRPAEELQKGAMLCRDCHHAVHHFLSNKELGAAYFTVERLRAHPDVGRFVRWVRTRGGRHRVR